VLFFTYLHSLNKLLLKPFLLNIGPSRTKDTENRLKTDLRLQVSHGLYPFDFHETHDLSILCYEQPLHRISAKSNERPSNSAEEINYGFKEGMTLTRTFHKDLLLP